MTDHQDPPDVVDHGTSDVLAEDEIVHVSPAAAEQAESNGHAHESTFIEDVPDWNEPD